MRRLALPLALVAAAAGCVSVEGLPDPRGALGKSQRLVVVVNQSPGPWLVDAADSKAEAAAKISPVGFMVQTLQDQHTLSVSKDIQQYLPRPHYGLEARDSLLKSLRLARSSSTVLNDTDAGIPLQQLEDWNKASDQLDWRNRYFRPDPDQPAPRDYSKILNLDDALILDVNISFGTTADDNGQVMPRLAAASRVYRGDTSQLIWEHEDEMLDKVSSMTLAEFELQPSELTDRLIKMAPNLGVAVAQSFVAAFGLQPSTAAPHVLPGAMSGGLVSMSMFQNLSSSSTAPAAASSSPFGGGVSGHAPAMPPPPVPH